MITSFVVCFLSGIGLGYVAYREKWPTSHIFISGFVVSFVVSISCRLLGLP